MRNQISSLLSKFLRFLHDHTILALSILLFAGMFLILGNLFFLAQKTNEDLAVQYAALYIRSLEKFRSEYASQVVSRVEPLGVKVTHDYRDHEGAIPIPATFVIGLSESITEPQSGVKARLYATILFPGVRMADLMTPSKQRHWQTCEWHKKAKNHSFALKNSTAVTP